MKKSLSLTITFLLAAFLLFLSQLVWQDPVLPFEKFNQIVFGGLMPEPTFKIAAHHSSSDNIRGWLWSENFGWISTNCYNDYDDDKEFEDCCPGGTDCPLTPASGNYGLNYNTTNHTLTGYAWSEHLGWLCAGSTCPGQSPDGYPAWACVGTRKSDGTCLADCQEDFNYNESCDGVSDPDLVAHWKMNLVCDSEAGCGDYGYGYTPDNSSKGTHQAQLGPAFPADAPILSSGRFNNALSFDGSNDWLKVEDGPDLDLKSGFTLEGWIYLRDITTRMPPWPEQIMLRKNNAYALGVIPSTFNDFQAWLYINGSWQKYCFEDNLLQANYLNKWRHVALTYDGSYVRLYLDGLIDSIYLQTGEVNLSDSPLYLGGEETGAGNAYLYGDLDNIAIYSRVKSPAEIWLDAKKEITGWLKVVNQESDQGWLKLADQISTGFYQKVPNTCHNEPALVSLPLYWGLFLDDHSQGGGFYTLGGLSYAQPPPNYYYWRRAWSWSADLDHSNQAYGLGWLTGTHRYSRAGPQPFDSFRVENLSCVNNRPWTQLSWQPSKFAQYYVFFRCQADSADLCNSCSYFPYPVPRQACNQNACTTTDSYNLQQNTGYCYKILALNQEGVRWATNNPPTYPHPYWLKTTLCAINNPVLVQGNTCGRLEIYWNPTENEENLVDGYNLYRSVKANGCASLTSSNCLLIGHLGEGLSSQNLVAHWRMNEASWSGQENEVKDSSGYLNHGRAYGNAQTTAGKFKRAGSFDGSGDYLLVNDADLLDFSAEDSFTLAGWLKTSQTNGVILEKISTGPGYGLKINNSGQIECYLKDNQNNQVTATSQNSVNDNNWHYFTCLANRSNQSLQIYLDGRPDGNPADLSQINDLSNDQPLKIAGTSAYYAGLLDNLSLTRRAKSNNEIRFEYEAQPLSNACQVNQDQFFKYGQANTSLNCSSDGPCCQFIDRRITPKTTYYYWVSQLTEAGESPAKEPATNCQSPGENYRYGCDKTLCAEKVEEREK
jgi:hypothetical protein